MSVFRSLMMAKKEEVLYNGVTDNAGYELNYKFALDDTFVFSYRLIQDLVALSNNVTFFGFQISTSTNGKSSFSVFTQSDIIKIYTPVKTVALDTFDAKAGDVVSFVFKVTSKGNTTIGFNLQTRINGNTVNEINSTTRTTNQQILNVSMNPTYVGNVKVTKV